MRLDWASFNHDTDLKTVLSEPEPASTFSQSDDSDDPIVRLPPAEFDPPAVGARALSQTHPWHTSPADIWHEVHDIIENYIGGVVVAILDTGGNPHEMLPEPLAEESFINGQSPRDGNGHGTHVASTAIASDGIHGVAKGAQWVIGKCLSNGGSGASSGIAACVRWARDLQLSDHRQVNVINMSLGGPSRYQPTIDAILSGYTRQPEPVHTLCAAGNAGNAGMGFPAKDPDVEGIAAHDVQQRIASFSSRGQVHYAAPGVSIVGASARSRTGKVSMSGTSMATPFSSGMRAVLTALHWASGLPTPRTLDDIMKVMKAYMIDIARPGYDPAAGHGAVDFPRMVRDIALWKTQFFTKVGVS